MDYNKIIILLIAVIVVIIVAGTVFLMDPFREESKVVIITNDTVHAGNTFLFELTDLKDNPIANANVSISIRDNNSRIIVNEHLTTNNHGEASLEIVNISAGNYSVNITFNGNDKYKASNLTYNLKIIDDAVEVLSTDNTASTSVDTGSFYSGQVGRTVYSGEVHLGPDGHHWKHLGNNEWVKID
ncbi:Ig-like domain-containing protein [uncultured Methanobrevibacter sp.]|uniref:Ig-like domain-containing protein n=1 Tax=uncultured Methanobrevibacter sp. TaxID=253161 RepID=UPI0025F9791C|nr:hypothetical protein [uncultured Methanobrevibacter sp.]